MPASSPGTLKVSASEDGMKLLRFLERRLAEQVPKAALHKWIRTGQVRVNKGRAKPFFQLAAGDLVRIPPFAPARNADVSDIPGIANSPLNLGPDIRVVAGNEHLLALAKPAGLPCQPGSGHGDSLCARLARAFSGAPFIPAPAHRIDRHTSGLVLAGMTHACQRRLHALFASGGITKEYLAWVTGDWRQPGPCLLEDRLSKKTSASGHEGMTALPGGKTTPLPCSGTNAPPWSGPAGAAIPGFADADQPGFAASAALAVCTIPEGPLSRATLLLLRLFTGRTHQLRVQLASRGVPIIGDGRYGGPHFSPMLLHAFALSLPEEAPLFSAARPAPPDENAVPGPGRLEFTAPPSWPEPFMPDAALLFAARQRLASALAVPASHFANRNPLC